MSITASARLWRWPVFIVVVLVAVACLLVFSNDSMYLPGADGRRYARQFVVAWLPVLGGVLLIDPTPEITATLPRARPVYLGLRMAMAFGVLAPLAMAWFLSDQPLVKGLYEAFIVGVLLTCSVLAVSLWQASGVLTASLISVLWLLAGDTLAEVLSNPVDEPSQAACWMAWSEGSGSTSLPSLKVAPARTLATRWGARIARHLFCADCISLNAIAIPAARLPGPFVTR